MNDVTEDKEIPLADQFLEDTYRAPRLLTDRGPMRRDIENIMGNYRLRLRKTHRFYLDDDFTTYASMVANRTPAMHMVQRIPSALLPYENTWIEFNLHRKVQVSMDSGTTINPNPSLRDVPQRMGLLLERDTRRTSGWSMTLVSELLLKSSNKTIVLPHPSMALFDAAGVIRPVAGYAILPGEVASTLHGAPWGYTANGEIKVPDQLHKCCRLSISPLCIYMMTQVQDKKAIERDYLYDLQENVGTLRWVITVLMMLAEVPTIHGTFRPQGERLVGMQRRHYMDYHRVSIKLPKTRPVQYIERRLRHADTRRHRAHEVREHWRTYLTDSGLSCQHTWLVDHDNGYRLCETCESFGRRIKEHQRGDPKLGFVRKDYILEKGRMV